MYLFLPILCSVVVGFASGIIFCLLEFQIPRAVMQICICIACIVAAAGLCPVAALMAYFVLIRHALEGDWDETVRIAAESNLLFVALLTHVVARLTSRRLLRSFAAVSVICYAATYVTFITSPIDVESASSIRYWAEVDRLVFFWLPAVMTGSIGGTTIAQLASKTKTITGPRSNLSN